MCVYIHIQYIISNTFCLYSTKMFPGKSCRPYGVLSSPTKIIIACSCRRNACFLLFNTFKQNSFGNNDNLVCYRTSTHIQRTRLRSMQYNICDIQTPFLLHSIYEMAKWSAFLSLPCKVLAIGIVNIWRIHNLNI